MLKKIILSAAMVIGCAGIARASDQEDMKAALQKLADSPNYTWKSTVAGGMAASESTGMTQKDGLTLISMTRQGNTVEMAVKGKQFAIKTDDGWKSGTELTGDDATGQQRMLATVMQTFKTPIAQAQASIDKLENIKKTDDGYTADLSAEAAKAMMALPRRGANAPAVTITNPKVSIKVWCKDGVLSKMENHTTATITLNGEDHDIDRTTTTEFSDIGSTTVAVPDEAKAKLTAGATTQP
jgi:hypothetical protein